MRIGYIGFVWTCVLSFACAGSGGDTDTALEVRTDGFRPDAADDASMEISRQELGDTEIASDFIAATDLRDAADPSGDEPVVDRTDAQSPMEIAADPGHRPGDPCLVEEDCGEALHCDPERAACVECLKPEHCGVGDFCAAGTCTPWACVPGSRVCDGSYLKTCSEQGDEYESVVDCDDHDPCTAGDVCVDRRCVTGQPADCSDDDPCTADACDPADGCVHMPLDGVSCDDGDPCSVADTCVEGVCIGSARDCSDGNPCTDDDCDPILVCRHRPNQALCDDENPCTVADRCVLGRCIGEAFCDDQDACTLDRCDGGICFFDPAPDCGPCASDESCDDGNPCSRDSCEMGECVYEPSSEPGCCAAPEDCEDGDPCTASECIGAPFGTCRVRAAPGPACCRATVFEAIFPAGDLQGFVPDAAAEPVGWYVASGGPAVSAPAALHYGNPAGGYATGDAANQGSVVGPQVFLPAGVSTMLRFFVFLDVEPSEQRDVLTVELVSDSGTFVAWKKPGDFPMKTWQEILVDVSVLQAHPVRLRFGFDTVDGLANSGAGVYLDDIRLVSTCKPPACATDLDCRSLGLVGSCEANACMYQKVLAANGTFAGPGAGPGEFQFPFDVAVQDDLVMVSDKKNHRVQAFDLDGTFRFMFGSQGSGDGQFQEPHGLALVADRVYVADTKNHRIQVFSRLGVFLFAFGGPGSATGRFNEPKDVAASADGGVVYVADTSNHRVQAFDPDGNFVLAFGEYGKKQGQFRSPSCVFVTAEYGVLVCDTQNQRVQMLTYDGQFLAQFKGTAETALDNPYGAVLAPDGLLYVADFLHHRLVMFHADGTPWGVFGAPGGAPGQFQYPTGLAARADGRLYVADSSNHRIVRIEWTAFP